MAKGKKAASAANRRYEAAVEHTNRLTEELAAAKIRARDAESRAARLEGIEKHLATSSSKNDELVVALTEKLKWWNKTNSIDRERRLAAFKELVTIMQDAGAESLGMGRSDRIQFLQERYPALMLALIGDEWVAQANTHPLGGPHKHTQRKLARMDDDGESLRRFQRLTGDRVTSPDGKDAAVLLAELLDAKQAGFTIDETLEYAGLEDLIAK